MIEVAELKFRYRHGGFRLHVGRLSVEQGATAAIVGPSGSGKTTLLQLIAGISPPLSGTIRVNQVEISAMEPRQRREFRIRQIGMVFQQFELLEHLTVIDNILLPCRLTSSLRIAPEHRQRAAELAAETGIADKLRRHVGRLSQGERQRVALCRALLLAPPVLLCDEPTGNLDPANKRHVLDILFRYVADNGTTLLTVTHDHQLLPRFDQTVDFAQFHGEDEAA